MTSTENLELDPKKGGLMQCVFCEHKFQVEETWVLCPNCWSTNQCEIGPNDHFTKMSPLRLDREKVLAKKCPNLNKLCHKFINMKDKDRPTCTWFIFFHQNMRRMKLNEITNDYHANWKGIETFVFFFFLIFFFFLDFFFICLFV